MQEAEEKLPGANRRWLLSATKAKRKHRLQASASARRYNPQLPRLYLPEVSEDIDIESINTEVLLDSVSDVPSASEAEV